MRYRIRKDELFRSVADFILRSNSRIVSYNSIYQAVKQKCKSSIHTIMKYVSLNSIRCMNTRFDVDHNLENVVYNEIDYSTSTVRHIALKDFLRMESL
ncbi:hypothetical protein EOM86_03185 [Candidatus Nomurabacteria bacterium]|nr:hypothetical protein [Candidatus Nomurabacteria bacterium]